VTDSSWQCQDAKPRKCIWHVDTDQPTNRRSHGTKIISIVTRRAKPRPLLLHDMLALAIVVKQLSDYRAELERRSRFQQGQFLRSNWIKFQFFATSPRRYPD